MTAAAPTSVPLPPSVWRGVRSSLSAFVDDIGRFAAANALWAAVVVATAALAGRQSVAVVLGLAAVPVAGAMGRMAARSARRQRPDWHDFRDGFTHRCPGAWVVGGSVSAVLVVAGLNITLAASSGGAALVLSALASLHIAAFAAAVFAATWPLLMDPARDGQPTRAVLRHGLVVLATRPRALLAVVLVDGVLFLLASDGAGYCPRASRRNGADRLVRRDPLRRSPHRHLRLTPPGTIGVGRRNPSTTVRSSATARHRALRMRRGGPALAAVGPAS